MVLLELHNDGLGTEAQVETGRAEYIVLPKAPGSVVVFSETHPFSSEWYGNNNPVISWERDIGVTGFSFLLDDKPNTSPLNEIISNETTYTQELSTDGLWYFHIKAFKNGAWGSTEHFLIRVDTTPPAQFTPQVSYLVASPAVVERALVSFFTTDNLSGVEKYEVGVIDKSQPITVSPVFVQTESPFQVPLGGEQGLQVIVRAIDKAGNIRDTSIDIVRPFIITKLIKDNLIYILIGIILIGFSALILHYLVGHHIIRNLRRAFKIVQKEEIEAHVETKEGAGHIHDSHP